MEFWKSITRALSRFPPALQVRWRVCDGAEPVREGKDALRYEKIFGKGNFFLELQDHGISEQRMVNQQL